MTAEAFFQLAGLVLCGTVLAWMSLGLTHTALGLFASRRKFALEQRLLQRQIDAAQRLPNQRQAGWDGWRKFRVKWKTRESDDCYSFYLVPHDGKPLPPYSPGQYVTLRLRIGSDSKDVVRCYSLSDRPRSDCYRLTIKKQRRVDGSFGIASSHLLDSVAEDDILDVASPKGGFHINMGEHRPVVLLAAGIGITPMMSMINTIVEEGSGREAYLFYGVRHGGDHTFRERLETVAREHPNVRVLTCYSRPLPQDVAGRDFDHASRLTSELVRQSLPSSNFEFYLCGPGEFTAQMLDELRQWQVPSSSIHYEAFGPATPTRPKPAANASAATAVTFSRSNCQGQWTEGQTLLEVAEAQRIPMESGCRVGNCGACITAVKAGNVVHTQSPGTDVPTGSCLPCVAIPDGPVTLDS
ncbi:MAG: 2Fe-2S iron-sulfur cluster binding domain-containing protein [Planctomycetales bacterium]|nr:2Fe-2S iron-sulfur cluster binding domain-containing protein [Planctomycetales bacterium]